MRIVTTIVFGICLIAFGFAQEPNKKVITPEDVSISHRIIIEYDKYEFLPSDKGKEIIDKIGKMIINSKLDEKYQLLFQVVTCTYEKEKTPLIDYKRVEFLLNYLEKEYDIESFKFNFVFIRESLFCDSEDPKSMKSYIQFTLTGSE